MRFGMSDAFLPERMADFTPEIAARVRELGFAGIFTRFTGDHPDVVTRADCRRVRDILAAEGVSVFQATGYRAPLVHPEEPVRRQAVQTLRAALKIAGDLGARSIDTGPGSVSPNGPWCPHPYNFTPRACEQLVKSVREAASAAEEHGVLLCLEGHQLVTLRSADIMCEVIDAVDSPWVKVDLDPVNWITIDSIYESGPAIDAMVATLGDRIASAHVKDALLTDEMVVHIEHCAPGDGIVDLGALLRNMEQLDPDAPVITEETTTKQLPGVLALLRRIAAEHGIEERT